MAANQTTKTAVDESGPAAFEEFRGYLLRYALLQLRDPAAAEDAVQETLLAAIQASGRFSGKSSVKTWLTGILKHKIIDHVRRQSREQPLLADGDSERSEAEMVDALFAADGHWRDAPASWGDPDRAFENRRFWEVFEMCASMMPPRMARIFAMREVLDLSTEEICKELDITATNCWVLLHRARLSLRACLETKWFGKS
ncbi:MAG TPA: sigma-70 family RNA polymerase sigma factor [Burkholderiales bacterium]|jgi:RNA polymerase sigma-70 factor (ECF subfamily)|nr:sigma-70 family RNA polymerase sigma factor [Burkholderiales bacterium]